MQKEETARNYIQQQKSASRPISAEYLCELTGWDKPAAFRFTQAALTTAPGPATSHATRTITPRLPASLREEQTVTPAITERLKLLAEAFA